MVQDKMYTGCFDITRNNKSLYAVAWLISPDGERVWEFQKRVEGLIGTRRPIMHFRCCLKKFSSAALQR